MFFGVGYELLLTKNTHQKFSGQYIKKVNVEKEYDVYKLIRLFKSQQRSLKLLRDAQSWFKTNPTGPGSEDIGTNALNENFNRNELPLASKDVEQLSWETNELNSNISNASPYPSDNYNMNRKENYRNINSILPRFKALHKKTLAELKHRWVFLRGKAVFTKRDQVYMQIYEDVFDILPKQNSERALIQSLSNRFDDYIGGEEDEVGGSAFDWELSNLQAKRKTLKLIKTNSAFKQDKLVKTYVRLYEQRFAATKKLAKAWANRNEEVAAMASTDYVKSVLGFQDIREKVEIALVGRVVLRLRIKKSRKVKLPTIVWPRTVNAVYGVARTYSDPRRYFLVAIDDEKDKLVGMPTKLPIQPRSAIKAGENLLLFKDATRLLFFNSSRAKFTGQIIIPISGAIELAYPDENKIYVGTGLLGATVINTKTRKIISRWPRLLHPFELAKNVNSKTLVIGLEQSGQKFRYVVVFYDDTTYEKVGDSVELPNTPIQSYGKGKAVSASSGNKIYIALEDNLNLAGREVRQAGQNIAVINTANRSLKTLSIHPKAGKMDQKYMDDLIVDMAVGSDGTIYILQATMHKFWVRLLNKSTDKVIRSITGEGYPTSLAIDNNQKLYVAVNGTANRKNNGIYVYNIKDGALIRIIKLTNLQPWLLLH